MKWWNFILVFDHLWCGLGWPHETGTWRYLNVCAHAFCHFSRAHSFNMIMMFHDQKQYFWFWVAISLWADCASTWGLPTACFFAGWACSVCPNAVEASIHCNIRWWKRGGGAPGAGREGARSNWDRSYWIPQVDYFLNWRLTIATVVNIVEILQLGNEYYNFISFIDPLLCQSERQNAVLVAPKIVPWHCRYDIMREDKVGSVNRSERGFLEFAAATFFEVNMPSVNTVRWIPKIGRCGELVGYWLRKDLFDTKVKQLFFCCLFWMVSWSSVNVVAPCIQVFHSALYSTNWAQ